MQTWFSYFSSVIARSLEATLTSFGQTWITLVLLTLPFLITWLVQYLKEAKIVGWSNALSLPKNTLALKIEAAVVLVVFSGNFLLVTFADHVGGQTKIADMESQLLRAKTNSDKADELSYQLNEAREGISLLQDANARLQTEMTALREKGKANEADRPRLQVFNSSFEKLAGEDRIVIYYSNYGRYLATAIDGSVLVTVGEREMKIRDRPKSPLELPPGAHFGLQVLFWPSEYDEVLAGKKSLEYRVVLTYKDERGKPFRYEQYGYYDRIVKAFTFGG